MEVSIQISVTLLRQQVAANVQIIVVLQKELRHYSLWDLREALLEVLQDVVVDLRASLRHPEPPQRVKGPKDSNVVSSPWVKSLCCI